MSKNLKIIIAATIIIIITILAFFILPKVIPYTPSHPNIVKTDQGSFELRITQNHAYDVGNNNQYSYKTYKEYESYAKDYYSRISKIVNDPNLIVNAYLYFSGEGIPNDSLTFNILNQNQEFKSQYRNSI